MLNTLNYSEMTQAFMSFMSSNPKWYLDFKNKYYSFDSDNRMWLHNSKDALVNSLSLVESEDPEVDIQTSDRSFIRFISNNEYSATKVFDNIRYTADGMDDYTVSFMFRTSKQDSLTIENPNIDKREETYKFAIPRQLGVDMFAPRMTGKYIATDLTLQGSGQNIFVLPYIETIYRYSMI